jgi:hypothetical protein
LRQATPQFHPLASNNQALPVPRRIWFAGNFRGVPDLLDADRTVSGMSDESGWQQRGQRSGAFHEPSNGH